MRASVVVPTRNRAPYLRVALRSLLPQVAQHDAELVVVDDGSTDATAEIAAALGVRCVSHPGPRGLNAARNTGIASTTGELVCFVDDDVEVRPGWLAALLDGAARHADAECFTGPIAARFDGFRPRLCGREAAPVTTLDLGPADVEAPHAWGANMAVRRSAIERIGPFDASMVLYGGDEQEWQARLHAAGGRIVYLAGAALDHRRAGRDAHVGALASAARRHGRAARREDVEKGVAPPLRAELRVLAGTLLHGPRFRCANGPILTAHTFGRIEEALRPAPKADFLSGRSGTVGGRRRHVRAALDALLDRAWRRGDGAGAGAGRRVLVVGIERPGSRMPGLRAELERSRHDVTVLTGPPGDRGKFQNLNVLLASCEVSAFDWVLVVDDDVAVPYGFLDRFLALAERYGLELAQPAHRLVSHAAWPVTRRRPASLVRETAFVEIGPITAFSRAAAAVLLPFPDLRMGWGLDAHWAAVARERGWRIGVVDATPILHATPAASAYGHDDAIAEAREFLAGRPYVPRDEANRTLRTHR